MLPRFIDKCNFFLGGVFAECPAILVLPECYAFDFAAIGTERTIQARNQLWRLFKRGKLYLAGKLLLQLPGLRIR